jgi:hypothetical protein
MAQIINIKGKPITGIEKAVYWDKRNRTKRVAKGKIILTLVNPGGGLGI